ncbi:MAG: hypoxanthine phosphoribosyltransferase [Coriobacteriia bacterium]|nr:hypoxanthine phosphoribosyltransferase [Coriobacteriia bacterium]
MGAPLTPEKVVDRVLISDEEIQNRVRELGREITADHVGRDVRLVTVLRGGLFFLADLCRAVDLPLQVDFMAVSSYLGGRPGVVRITKDLDDPIEGAAVIVVEDIVDTGLTLNYILRMLKGRRPASLEVCALLDKDVRRIVDLPIAYRGFSIPDKFVVGYGLDLQGFYRNLPFVATVRDEALQEVL